MTGCLLIDHVLHKAARSLRASWPARALFPRFCACLEGVSSVEEFTETENDLLSSDNNFLRSAHFIELSKLII